MDSYFAFQALRPRARLGVPDFVSQEISMPDRESVIQSDPEILGGTPVFVGTRVPLKNLIDYLAAGDSLDDFPDDFPSVTREQAIAARNAAGQSSERARE